ncbi:hypothetical protein XA68_15265 [Ophiocordyceps unilateralis]|uniref:NAA35-like N-terminal domain-containing protein n=1 Tax=Ophiocordyceps unilateralis TaxID=268505 RepID=A0A2A9PMD0_OPHUN|nr:hypothetical protein XA68_15265 [Ophiocordyceps unilateralis]
MAGHGDGDASEEIARLSLGQAPDSPPPPPPPNMESPGIMTLDITSDFADAVRAALGPGELIKDVHFTLFESVAALEIMDPKMDSGCVRAGDESDALYDVSTPLLPDEVLGIIDQLLCHEMSWHLGYPLSQTLFTSVHVEALLMPTPATVHEACFVRHADATANQQPMLRVLRAYCLGMLKACGYVNERIKSEHYYEEEDFVTNTPARVPEELHRTLRRRRSHPALDSTTRLPHCRRKPAAHQGSGTGPRAMDGGSVAAPNHSLDALSGETG